MRILIKIKYISVETFNNTKEHASLLYNYNKNVITQILFQIKLFCLQLIQYYKEEHWKETGTYCVESQLCYISLEHFLDDIFVMSSCKIGTI